MRSGRPTWCVRSQSVNLKLRWNPLADHSLSEEPRRVIMSDSGMGIVGVIVGALLVGFFVFFVFGNSLGIRGGGKDVSVRVEAPKVPATK